MPKKSWLYDINEAAGLLSVDSLTLQHWIAAGIIRTVRKGTKLFITRSEIVRLSSKRLSEKISASFSNQAGRRTPLLYGRKNAAAALDISLRSLDYLLEMEFLERRRLGRRTLVHHKDLERLSQSDQLRWLRPPSPNETEKSDQSHTAPPTTDDDDERAEEETANG